jgi:hypothetical protein
MIEPVDTVHWVAVTEPTGTQVWEHVPSSDVEAVGKHGGALLPIRPGLSLAITPWGLGFFLVSRIYFIFDWYAYQLCISNENGVTFQYMHTEWR